MGRDVQGEMGMLAKVAFRPSSLSFLSLPYRRREGDPCRHRDDGFGDAQGACSLKELSRFK